MESTLIAADVVGEMTERMERVHEQPKSRHRPRADVVEDGSVEHGVNATDLQRELDELLDEVDAVLEENAEEFVKAYVQKGGE
jgi:ubiquitin-like protein Pup